MLFRMLFTAWRSSSDSKRRAALKKQKPVPSVRLCLECLEDRTVPSTWIGQGSGPILNGGVKIPGGPEAGAVQALAVDPSHGHPHRVGGYWA
jgi:hypothetical protein